MSTFFDRRRPQPPTPPTDRERDQANAMNDRRDAEAKGVKVRSEAEAANIEHAKTLIPHFQYLRDEIVDLGKEPNAVVVDTFTLKTTPIQKFGRLMVEHKRDRRHISPYLDRSRADNLGYGWVISTASSRENNRAIILMESGEIKMTTPDTVRTDKYGKPNELPRFEYEGSLDLETYPVHPYFKQEQAYAQSISEPTPLLVTAGKTGILSEQANVAMNLEKLERDLLANGTDLLR